MGTYAGACGHHHGRCHSRVVGRMRLVPSQIRNSTARTSADGASRRRHMADAAFPACRNGYVRGLPEARGGRPQPRHRPAQRANRKRPLFHKEKPHVESARRLPHHRRLRRLRRFGRAEHGLRSRHRKPYGKMVRTLSPCDAHPARMRSGSRNRRNIQVARRRHALHHRGTAHGAFRNSHDRTRVVVPRGLLLRLYPQRVHVGCGIRRKRHFRPFTHRMDGTARTRLRNIFVILQQSATDGNGPR